MSDTDAATDLVFYLNGKRIRRQDVDPTTLLVDFLRSPEVGLTGTKIGCKQGGCGACTVLLSRWNETAQAVEHSSINSCLRPLAALDGMAITTVEGTGSVQSECISVVQNCVATNNATQCGYCTPGWVMNMTAAVARGGPKPGTKQEIEALFDGNICRCTGYRPILYGFKKQFASDWNPQLDEAGCMSCLVDPAEQVENVAPVVIAFPDELKRAPRTVSYAFDGYHWLGATSLQQVLDAMARTDDRANLRLVGGNTSIGIYPRTVENPHYFIDLSNVPEMRAASVEADALLLGAGMTYSEVLDVLQAAIKQMRAQQPGAVLGLQALEYMAGRTAGTIVRNAATLAGNTMLVVRHSEQGIPFPSDLFTALAALGATLSLIVPGREQAQTMGLLEFAQKWPSDQALQDGCVLLEYRVPFSDANTYTQTYKTALREVNAHSIANAGFSVQLGEDLTVSAATLVVGGVSPIACRLPQTEAALLGQVWSAALLETSLPVLRNEVLGIIEAYAAHYAQLPAEGVSDGYRLALCESFFYKFFIEVAQWCELPVPPQIRSAGERSTRTDSRGAQAYAKYPDEYPVNQPFVKIEAFLQATGEAQYTHDIPMPRRALNGAPVQSTVALGSCSYVIPGAAAGKLASPQEVLAALQCKFPSVVDYVTAIDVPGPVFCGTAADDPLFAVSVQASQCNDGALPANYDVSAPMWVSGFGQCIGMVMAEDEQVAQQAAWYVQTELCVFVAEKPLLNLPDNDAARNQIVYLDKPPGATWYSHIWQITRAGTVLDWVPVSNPDTPDAKQPVLDYGVPVPDAQHTPVSCTMVSSQQIAGSQLHFYMETQSCVAELLEDRQMRLFASTQSPDTIQSGAARVLNLPLNKVDVRVRRLGGGYGGKCGQSEFAANMAAVAAWKNTCTVRLAMLRQVDSAMFGHRHALMGNYHIAIGDASNQATHGKLLGFQVDYWWDGGRTYDCSFVISDTGSLRSDSAYMIPNWNCASDVCRTNKTTSTSMRTVGMLQSAIVVEDAIEAAAHSVALSSEEVRMRNMYRQGESTPYGEPLDSCYMREVFAYTMDKADFRRRQEQVDTFNRNNRWKKRGISLIPVKYGSGYNLTALEQGGALIEVYDQDGSVLVRHGGIEMGQGLNTKVAQVVALALNVSLVWIRVAEMDTAVVPNPESTGASTGTSFNALPAQRACQELRARLELYCKGLLAANGQAWCASKHINYWDYPEGWRATPAGQTRSLWQNIVSMAFGNRVNLSAQARVRIAGGTRPDTGLTFKLVDGVPASEPVDYFTGYTFSAACTEVEIDVLTGETTILRADIVYDAGKSLNPAIDVGQVEGGFVQGLGYVTSEELTYQPADSPTAVSATRPAPGALYTINTWEYKPPAAQSIPLEMNVMLFPRELAPYAPPDKGDILSSKEMGEPPMTLAVSGFIAIKKAVLAARADRGHKQWFHLDSPANVQAVRAACLVGIDDMDAAERKPASSC